MSTKISTISSKGFFIEMDGHILDWCCKKHTTSGELKTAGTVYQILIEGRVNLNAWDAEEVINHLEEEGLLRNVSAWYRAYAKASVFGDKVAEFVWELINGDISNIEFEGYTNKQVEYSTCEEERMAVYTTSDTQEYRKLQQLTPDAAGWFIADKHVFKDVQIIKQQKGYRSELRIDGKIIASYTGRLMLSTRVGPCSSPYYENGNPKKWEVGEIVVSKGDIIDMEIVLPEGYSMYNRNKK